MTWLRVRVDWRAREVSLRSTEMMLSKSEAVQAVPSSAALQLRSLSKVYGEQSERGECPPGRHAHVSEGYFHRRDGALGVRQEQSSQLRRRPGPGHSRPRGDWRHRPDAAERETADADAPEARWVRFPVSQPAAGPEREWLYELVERMGIGGRFQVDMRTPAEVSQQESPSSVTSLNAAISFLAVLGVFVVFIAVVVSANTYSTSVLKRTREIALLRAVAATTNQVRLLIVGESLVVSPVAAAVGCVAGVQLAAVFAPILVQGGLAPVGFRAPVSLLPLLLAIAISVGAGVLSVVTAVWRVARIRPVDAFQEAAVERPAIGPIRVLAGLAITMFGAS